MQHKKTCFVFRHSLFHSKPYLKKWVCPDNLIYYTTDVYPPHPPPSYGELFSTELAPIFLRHSLIFIYVHLFLFVRTSFYLSEPILICQNLFLFVKTYFHLCALIFVCENLFLFMIIFENLFLFMIICENLFSLSLYEKKQVYEHHHLKQIFCHQNMIMIFWWFHTFQFYVFCFEFFSFCALLFVCLT